MRLALSGCRSIILSSRHGKCCNATLAKMTAGLVSCHCRNVLGRLDQSRKKARAKRNGHQQWQERGVEAIDWHVNKDNTDARTRTSQILGTRSPHTPSCEVSYSYVSKPLPTLGVNIHRDPHLCTRARTRICQVGHSSPALNMHHLLSQGQRELVTARLFRRESIKTIAEDMKVSERSIQRISTNLRKYGTTVAPRDPKLMGRPPLLTKEMHEVSLLIM